MLLDALARCGASSYDDELSCQGEARRADPAPGKTGRQVPGAGPFLFVLMAACPNLESLADVFSLTDLSLLLLAQEGQPPAHDTTGSLTGLLFPLVIIMLLFYFMLLRPQKRKEEEFRQMVSNLKENDHVVTVGGIYGVVTNVQRDADRITIRVDESTGTKLRISSSAIARVVTDDDQNGDGAAGSKSKKS